MTLQMTIDRILATCFDEHTYSNNEKVEIITRFVQMQVYLTNTNKKVALAHIEAVREKARKGSEK